jgi:copper chaperone
VPEVYESATHLFQIEGMHCASCALLIDDTLEDLPGVNYTRTTMKEGHNTVELDVSQISPQEVIAAIEALGYQAVPLRG